jgi:hypothetical protein
MQSSEDNLNHDKFRSFSFFWPKSSGFATIFIAFNQELNAVPIMVITDENGLKPGRFWSKGTEGTKLITIPVLGSV